MEFYKLLVVYLIFSPRILVTWTVEVNHVTGL
jgi:hypothetical protein